MALTTVKGATFQSDENFLYVNVKDFGAIGDGIADDVPAIQAAIDSIPNGGTVFIPRGTYRLASGVTGAIQLKNNVHVRGGGIGATTLILGDAINLHVFNAANQTDWSVTEMTIDGNKANNTGTVSGFRLFGIARCAIRNLEIKDTRFDGVSVIAGTNTDYIISGVVMSGIGGNGVGALNLDDANDRQFIDNVYIASFGDLVSGAAGLDLRGPWIISNVKVQGVLGNDSGIRLRDGELLSANGLGAHRSVLNNFVIEAGEISTTRGLAVLARDCNISNGYISGAQINTLVADARNNIANVTHQGGFLQARVQVTAASGGSLFDAAFVNCVFQDGTQDGFDVEASRVHLQNCWFLNNVGNGINVNGTANDTLIQGCVIQGNGTQVLDNGVNTHARNNTGWLTEAYITGGALLWDTAGLKSELIAHGLDVTPTLQQCRIAKVKVTGNNDGAFDWTMVSAVDATNVTADSVVGTVNTLANATFNHLVYINARP